MLLLSLADSVPLVGRKWGSRPGFLLFFRAPNPLRKEHRQEREEQRLPEKPCLLHLTHQIAQARIFRVSIPSAGKPCHRVISFNEYKQSCSVSCP